MKAFNSLGRTSKILIVSIFAIIIAVFFFISPILKYVIEKNSKEWVGRVIRMDDLNLNIFSGNLTISGIKMLEKNDQTLFFSSENIQVNFELYKLITGNYTISEVNITNPYVKIVRSPKGFNFDDLTASDSTAVDTASSDPVHFRIDNININSGIIDYLNAEFENNIKVTNFNFHSDGIAWDDKGTQGVVSFTFANDGKASIHFGVDYDSMNYKLKLDADRIGLSMLTPYIYDFLKINDFKCYMSCNALIKGNANETTDLSLSGVFQLDDILLTGSNKDSLVALKNFSIGIDSVNLKNNIFNFSYVKLTNPYILFELYDNESNNFFALMQVDSTSTENATSEIAEESTNPFLMMSDFVKEIANSYDMNSYNVDSFLISGGKIVYKDYTLLETFSYHLTDLKIWSNSLRSKAEKVEIDAFANLNYSGKFEASLSYDPGNYKDMDLYYRISNMKIADMNPHTNFYVAYPFNSGILNYESKNSIRNMKLDSKNNLRVNKVEVGNRIDNKNAYNVPFKLGIALLKDVRGNIDLNIPVSGDLSDPKYKIGKIIWQVISNLLIKAVTSPYRLIANSLSVDEEDIKQINFRYLDTTFTSKQFKSIDVLKKVLEGKPDLTAQLAQYTNMDQEQEQFASWESRKQYWLEKQGLAMTDSLSEDIITSIDSVTIKDSLFVVWLDAQLGPQEVYIPVQEKIIKYVGEEKSRVAVQNMVKNRDALLQNYVLLIGIDSTRCTIYTEAPEKIPASESLPKYYISFGAATTPEVK